MIFDRAERPELNGETFPLLEGQDVGTVDGTEGQSLVISHVDQTVHTVVGNHCPDLFGSVGHGSFDESAILSGERSAGLLIDDQVTTVDGNEGPHLRFCGEQIPLSDVVVVANPLIAIGSGVLNGTGALEKKKSTHIINNISIIISLKFTKKQNNT